MKILNETQERTVSQLLRVAGGSSGIVRDAILRAARRTNTRDPDWQSVVEEIGRIRIERARVQGHQSPSGEGQASGGPEQKEATA